MKLPVITSIAQLIPTSLDSWKETRNSLRCHEFEVVDSKWKIVSDQKVREFEYQGVWSNWVGDRDSTVVPQHCYITLTSFVI